MLLVRTPQTIWLVYPLLLLETVMWGFFDPAHTAVIPNVTGVEDVMLANTLSSTTWSFDFAIGFTLGGLVATWFGRDTVFVLNSLSFLASAYFIGRMHFPEPHATNSVPLRWRDLTDYSPVLEGVRYIRHDARLLATVMLKGGVGMLGANWVILPIMGDRVFPVKVQTLGAQRGAMLGMSVLMGARGLGALLGPYLSARWAAGREPVMRRAILIAFVVAAAGYAGLACAPNVWLACAAVVLSHGAGSVIWVFSTTLLQIHTEDKFRGRVFSADLSFCMLGIAVTAYMASVAFDAGVSIRVIAFMAGVVMLLPALAWAFALRLWRD
jgi:MFS family permease